MTENIYDTVKQSLLQLKIKWAIFSEIYDIIDEEDAAIEPGQWKVPVLTLSNEFSGTQAFPYLLPQGKFDFNASLDFVEL